MNDYDELYEDDFEDDELGSVAAKSASCHAASMSTPHRPVPATYGTASKSGVITSTATGHTGAAAKSGMESAPRRPMCSLGSSFSSYQSSSDDPLLRSAHEHCCSSSTSSSRHHTDPQHPTKDSGGPPSAAESVKGHRALPDTDDANAVVIASDFVRTPMSPRNLSAVTPASGCPSVAQTPGQREIASSGTPKAYAKLDNDDGVQVIASMGRKQLRPMSPSEASATETAASSCTSFHSTSHASLSPGRAGSSRHGMPRAGSGSVSETGAKHLQRVKFAGNASRSSSVASCSSDDDSGSGCGRLHGTSPTPFTSAAAPPAAAVAPGIGAPVTRNVSAERRHSGSSSITTYSVKKLLHQSNYTSVDVLEADDDRGHRLTPAEIDAAAAPVDDEEGEEDHEDASASNTMLPVAALTAQRQRLASSPSGVHSGSFTSLTPSTPAEPSLTSHEPPSAHITTTAPSSSMAPTTRSSSNRAPPQNGPDSVSAHSSSRPHNSTSAVALQTSSNDASRSRSALCEASPKTQATSGAVLRGAIQRRQVTTVCNDAMDARLLDGVCDSQGPRDDRGDVDTDEDGVEKKPQRDARSKQLSSPPPPLPPSRTFQLSTTTSEDASLYEVGTAKTKGHTKVSTTAAKDGNAPESGERAALLARVAQLREEIATWDNRIARQRALIKAEAGRSDGAAASSSKCRSADGTGVARRRRGSNGGKQRSESVEQALHTQADAKGDGRPVNVRLTKLRRENEQLEAQYARQGAGEAEMSVQALVVRADTQLQKARLRLKEITAVRRALENRDKRAAHTIKEVHRRMPTADELEERQHNEGIYSRKGLLRTVKELKENVERTRAATKMMKARCAELEAHVRRKHLSSIPLKEYEALCATRDANVKAIEKHKTAIFVYTIAFAHELRNGSKSTCGGDAGVCATQSSRSSCTTSPFKPAISPVRAGATAKEQQQVIAEYEANKADRLLQQKRILLGRKQELQASIDTLLQRVEEYNEQIKVNHAQAGLGYLDANSAAVAKARAPLYAVGGSSPTRSTPATTSAVSARDCGVLVAGSGAVVARRGSLRDVLRSPVTRRVEAMEAAADAKGGGGAAIKHLRGGAAAARRRTPENANGHAKHSNLGLKALPALVQTGKRTARAEDRASLPALTAVLGSPVKAAAAQMGSSIAAGGEMPTSSRNAIEEELGDRDSIEAVLRRIDADNTRLGYDMFELEGRERAAPPAFPENTHDADPVKVADNVPGDGDTFEVELVPHNVNEGDNGGQAGGAGHHDHATSAAERLRGVYDRAMPSEPPTEEEEVEEELSAGNSDESGRSTPEWLRDD
ncbi:conserved hypothetical protein [Leishmania major strain Friedlin]|uniref:Uncharacterized protein n=1 Tax=Leishmania major TaxID=5664 RepID=Q4QDA5_LEIMA|nr:conserved hypothetical protein [Leishmania major strain Friedlin]CAG9572815.1 hypothetical_protein_-_conserved [Leishmania major strain Friedlin]CAJ07201.1 conserved hypothetical protein [Leishmania major strain Friedlin]|eukprot:XP_001682693.1 conserved hypothetical protein [Leishmania major strain Friedlin]